MGEHTATESMQVIHYSKGQYYQQHHDYFPVEKLIGGNRTRESATRIATILITLDNDGDGGHTVFPHAWHHQPDGLRVKQQKGDAIIFYSMEPDGNLDYLSAHEAQAVTTNKSMVNL